MHAVYLEIPCAYTNIRYSTEKTDISNEQGKIDDLQRLIAERHVRKRRITKVKEKRPVKAVKMLVLVLSVVAHSRRSCTTCIRGKRKKSEKGADG